MHAHRYKYGEGKGLFVWPKRRKRRESRGGDKVSWRENVMESGKDY